MRPRPLARFRLVCRERRTTVMAASCRAPAAGAVVPATCTQYARQYVRLLHCGTAGVIGAEW